MKNCDSLFCSNKCPKKFAYCRSCAKRKGLLGDDGTSFIDTFLGAIGFIFFMGIFIKIFLG